jgi:hypothetical protein
MKLYLSDLDRAEDSEDDETLSEDDRKYIEYLAESISDYLLPSMDH